MDNKDSIRAAKALHRLKKHGMDLQTYSIPGHINVACVLHSNKYDWLYVERLYSMVSRYCSRPFRFHVFTEHDRPVPATMHKHILDEWPGISGPKKSWWYKMQVFDPSRIGGPVLFLDLDLVLMNDIEWIVGHNPRYFWTVKDFRYLWRQSFSGINSSVMWWDTTRFRWIWEDFQSKNIAATVKLFHGDQDYLTSIIRDKDLRFLDPESIKSWRWQIKDGGMDFRTRAYRRPDAGSVFDPKTKIMIFHGTPKPHEIQDTFVQQHWI